MKEKIANIFTQIWNKIPQRLKDLLVKFYSNKKVFWPMTIAFGLIVFVILLGLIFGRKTITSNPTKNISSPTPQNNNITGEEDNSELAKIDKKLKDLKNQISSFDVKQSRLKPPSVNFDVRF